jgi:hypothetical protein
MWQSWTAIQANVGRKSVDGKDMAGFPSGFHLTSPG